MPENLYESDAKMKNVLAVALTGCIVIASSIGLTTEGIAQTHVHVHGGNKTVKVGKAGKVVRTEKTVRIKNSGARVKVVKVAPTRTFARTNLTIVRKRNVRVVQALPTGYSTIGFGGRNFFFHGGRYYNYVGNSYSMIAPPFGLRIRVLPVGYRRIFIGPIPHFYYGGVYYRQVGDEYETVQPAVGTIVPELPQDDIEEVTIDGQTLYEVDNILYKSVVTNDGNQYEVVGTLKD